MPVDVNKPVENPVLKALLNEYGNADQTQRNALAEKIAEETALRAHLLAVIHVNENDIEHHGDGTAVFRQNSSISFEMFKAADGTDFLPVYTDWEELRKYEKYKDIHINTLILSFDDIASITAGRAGAVIDPFSHNFVISPADIVHIKQHKDAVTKGYSENTVQKDTTVQIGEPADYPHEMAEAVRQYAKTDRSVKAVWLKLMIKENERSYLLIVDFDGDRDTVFSAIADTAVKHIHNGLPVDMVPYADSFGRKAASGKPIYKKKTGLFF